MTTTNYQVTNAETGTTWKREKPLASNLQKGDGIQIGSHLYTIEKRDGKKLTIRPGLCDFSSLGLSDARRG